MDIMSKRSAHLKAMITKPHLQEKRKKGKGGREGGQKEREFCCLSVNFLNEKNKSLFVKLSQ